MDLAFSPGPRATPPCEVVAAESWEPAECESEDEIGIEEASWAPPACVASPCIHRRPSNSAGISSHPRVRWLAPRRCAAGDMASSLGQHRMRRWLAVGRRVALRWPHTFMALAEAAVTVVRSRAGPAATGTPAMAPACGREWCPDPVRRIQAPLHVVQSLYLKIQRPRSRSLAATYSVPSCSKTRRPRSCSRTRRCGAPSRRSRHPRSRLPGSRRSSRRSRVGSPPPSRPRPRVPTSRPTRRRTRGRAPRGWGRCPARSSCRSRSGTGGLAPPVEVRRERQRVTGCHGDAQRRGLPVRAAGSLGSLQHDRHTRRVRPGHGPAARGRQSHAMQAVPEYPAPRPGAAPLSSRSCRDEAVWAMSGPTW